MIKHKPRVFIGSSKEAIPIVNAVHENLKHVAEVTPWCSGVFNPSNYTMEDLQKQIETNDFAIFIFHTDDVSKIRNKYYATVRDNTIFEMGLFMSKLGRRRVFFILPEVVPQKFEEFEIEGLRMPSDLFGMNALTYEIRTDGKWSPAVSVACSKISERILELDKWTDEIYELQLNKVKHEYENDKIRLFKLLRFYREMIRNQKINPDMIDKMSDVIRNVYISVPPFNVKGVAIFRENKNVIEQLSGNVGQNGRKYSLDVNDDKEPDDPRRILVVDSHKQNKVKISLYEDHIEKEYLICYPVAKRYVITVHIIGHTEVDDEKFGQIYAENEQLISTINNLLGGELG